MYFSKYRISIEGLVHCHISKLNVAQKIMNTMIAESTPFLRIILSIDSQQMKTRLCFAQF